MTETRTEFNPVAPLRHWSEELTEHGEKNDQGLDRKNTKPTVVRREEKRHMANMRVARKVKRQLTARWEAKKTGDQQERDCFVQSEIDGKRNTSDTGHDEAWGIDRGRRKATTIWLSVSPSSPPFPMVIDVSLQDVVSCILSFERRCKRFLVEERAN